MGLENAEKRLGSSLVGETKDLAAELCKHFYNQGWVSGTGGSITLKVLEPDVDVQERLIVMAPSGEIPPSPWLPRRTADFFFNFFFNFFFLVVVGIFGRWWISHFC